MYYILYNNKSNNGKGYETALEIEKYLDSKELQYFDVCEIENLVVFFKENKNVDKFILCGGDGTLNHFVNSISLEDVPSNLYYFPCGSGNDFYNDVKEKEEKEVIYLSQYLKKLPKAIINDQTYYFVNGVGYGIDGYCCEVADIQKKKTDKPINYTGIAVKGLLFHYKPTFAKVTVDGEEHEFKRVWLAPMMFGRYYGGGMKACPDQKRLESDHLSVLIWHGKSRLTTLMNFPKIFKGEHVLNEKTCKVYTGKHIIVEFDKPVAAQVDGETILNVTKCEVYLND